MTATSFPEPERDPREGAPLPADLQRLAARKLRRDAVAEAAAMLAGYGFTADDIRQGIAEGGSVEITAFGDER